MDEWQLKSHFIRFPDSPRTWSLPLASSPTDLLQGGGHLSTCPSSSERSHPACGLGYHGSAERRAEEGGLPPQEPHRGVGPGPTGSAGTWGSPGRDLGLRGQRTHQGSSEAGEAAPTPCSPPSWKPAPADPSPWKPGRYFCCPLPPLLFPAVLGPGCYSQAFSSCTLCCGAQMSHRSSCPCYRTQAPWCSGSSSRSSWGLEDEPHP